MQPIRKLPGQLIKLCYILVALLVLAWLVGKAREINHRNRFAAVTLTGVQHIGPDFNISDFYVDGYSGSNVGREGGGGSYVCCVLLPRTWRPGLSAEVRWQVGNWSQERLHELDQGNYDSIRRTNYKARVPIEKYPIAAAVYVHFFPGGRVRVIPAAVGVGGAEHPVQRNDPRAAERATPGTLIEELFTQAEWDERERHLPIQARWQ